MTPLREQLIKITAGMADEPVLTMEALEAYINMLVNDGKIEAMDRLAEMVKSKINTEKNKPI